MRLSWACRPLGNRTSVLISGCSGGFSPWCVHKTLLSAVLWPEIPLDLVNMSHLYPKSSKTNKRLWLHFAPGGTCILYVTDQVPSSKKRRVHMCLCQKQDKMWKACLTSVLLCSVLASDCSAQGCPSTLSSASLLELGFSPMLNHGKGCPSPRNSPDHIPDPSPHLARPATAPLNGRGHINTFLPVASPLKILLFIPFQCFHWNFPHWL